MDTRRWWSPARAGRRTNVALLWLTGGAFVSGWVAFAVAEGAPAWITTAAHGLLGLGVVTLAPWKTMIIRRSAMRWTSLVLLVVVLAGLLGGFAQLFVGWWPVLGLSAIQVHVGAAVIVVPLLAWHVLRHRPQRLRRADLSRRMLLQAGSLVAATGVGYGALRIAAGWTGGADRARTTTGSRPVHPDAIPPTIWLLDRVPTLPTSFRLEVAGRTLTAAELATSARPITARLDCTSGWYADATWTGRPLSELITADELAAAESLVVVSTTGYTRTFPAQEADRLWLVVASQGRPLSTAGGAPVRLVAPGRRGFWWVKWVARVELSDRPSWQQLPFPLQ